MKVLFVSSGNSKKGISPIVISQGKSLEQQGINLTYFTIKGKGIKGYLSNIIPLRKFLKRNSFDIIHSHYSLTSFIVSFAKIGLKIPQITSLMGSDVNAKSIWKFFIRVVNLFSWESVIVKSKDMKKKIGIKKNINVIPNGVNLKYFKSVGKKVALEIVNYDEYKKNIIWVSNPKRYEKNFTLAETAINILNDDSVKLNIVNGVNHQDISKYMYASDILILTSLWEGSPNVIKEAMACNLPIVATDVGDVRELIGTTKGCFITNFDPVNIAEKIQRALAFGGRTNGRAKLRELCLDSETVSKRIIEIYGKVV